MRQVDEGICFAKKPECFSRGRPAGCEPIRTQNSASITDARGETKGGAVGRSQHPDL